MKETDTLKFSDSKSKVTRLFQFIRAFTNSRHPIKRSLSEQPSNNLQIDIKSLPVESEWLKNWSAGEENREWLFQVKICAFVPCVVPPQSIKDWLLPGWEKYSELTAKHIEERFVYLENEKLTQSINFSDNDERIQSWNFWIIARNKWAEEQRRHDSVRTLFSKIQALRAELQKNSEQVELVLGVGFLKLKTITGTEYNHPLIIKPVDIEFEINNNSYIIRETERQTELYIEPLSELQIDLNPAGHWRDILQKIHPLDIQMSVLIDSMREWLKNQPELENIEFTSESVIFLRDKGGWPARAATAILDDLMARDVRDLPPYLLKLVGDFPTDSENTEPLPTTDFVANEDEQILFALPANLEQLQLARQIEKKDVVLVQGPPGTGKTHTIANLLGHLLSQGKRVLVTSHTSKALKVLRDKVPENIQSLCVSALDSNSRQSRKELEQAVQSIAEKMQDGTSRLIQKSVLLGVERSEILEKIKLLRQQQRLCIRREYEPLVLCGEAIEPSRAAREVFKTKNDHLWIPGPLNVNELGRVFPLSSSDIKWLYSSLNFISHTQEKQLFRGVPEINFLYLPNSFNEKLLELKNLLVTPNKQSALIWIEPVTDIPVLENLLALAQGALENFNRITVSNKWMVSLVEAGSDRRNFELGQEWIDLRSLIIQTITLFENSKNIILEYSPSLPKELLVENNLVFLDEIIEHFEKGGGLKVFQIPLKARLQGGWKSIIQNAKCNNKIVTKKEHFLSLKIYLQLHLSRENLRQRWGRQVEILGGIGLPLEIPEKFAHEWFEYIADALGWFYSQWYPLQEACANLGKSWTFVESFVKPQSTAQPRVRRALLLIEEHFVPEWKSQLAQLKSLALVNALSSLADQLQNEYPSDHNGVTDKLAIALRTKDALLYEKSYEELEQLWSIKADFIRRNELLKQLESGASEWCAELRLRTLGVGQTIPANFDLNLAWRCRQLNDILNLREKLNAEDIADELFQLNKALNKVTAELIATRCWASQLTPAEKYRLHLVGWLDSMRKIGKGTGKNVETYRAEARKQLKQGQRAIPVWIMPLASVFENLNVGDSRFDVVIIDEASQAGVSGLLAAYLGKKVIVVGDHEQVSPTDVGAVAAVSISLQNQYLQGFPNTTLYDGTLSLYDMSRWAASGMLTLSEHFRCLPAIIGFSNRLSYDGKIKPLRDPSSSKLRAVIPHRVAGSRAVNKKINNEEAFEIVALILAMCEHEDYSNRTIGVISLLGDDQAKLIDNLLNIHLPTFEKESRKIICGNAAEFQGDERDVVFLTMVDSNEGDGPMRKVGDGTNELTKKRYNVAASRAQNQMWIVHSLDYLTDLKSDDIRRELLDYAHNEAQNTVTDVANYRTDSEFEKRVLEALLKRGYQVKTQYAVGYYRIDMVIEFEGNKVALECDGEKWHSGEEKIAEDLARQAVLERLGWKFHRIRGSQFFKDPDAALELLWTRLGQLNIYPSNVSTPEKFANNSHENLLRIAASFRLEITELSG